MLSNLVFFLKKVNLTYSLRIYFPGIANFLQILPKITTITIKLSTRTYYQGKIAINFTIIPINRYIQNIYIKVNSYKITIQILIKIGIHPIFSIV